MMRVKVGLLLLVAFQSVLVLHSNPTAKRGGTLITATFTDIKTLNSFLATDSETPTYSRLINAGLTRLNPATQQPEPSLAESWEKSSDELEWTFRLRKNVRWSDGSLFGRRCAVYDANSEDSKITS